ncbi:Hpt domain-containing protein [Kiloniella sp. b19]|uniref:Hpt domain-containing protein n=1 Tax=Kiloniella sp. GXU_MW_B19 TaxID=3141326 RepID=UPI0031E00C46
MLPIRDDQIIVSLARDIGAAAVPELLERFRSDLSVHLDQLVHATESMDADLLQRESHTLKSICGTFGAAEFCALMREINEACRQGETQWALRKASEEATRLGEETLAAYSNDHMPLS